MPSATSSTHSIASQLSAVSQKQAPYTDLAAQVQKPRTHQGSTMSMVLPHMTAVEGWTYRLLYRQRPADRGGSSDDDDDDDDASVHLDDNGGVVEHPGKGIKQGIMTPVPRARAGTGNNLHKRRAAHMAGALAAYDTIRDFIPEPVPVAAKVRPTASTEDAKTDSATKKVPVKTVDGKVMPQVTDYSRVYIPRKLRVNRNDLHQAEDEQNGTGDEAGGEDEVAADGSPKDAEKSHAQAEPTPAPAKSTATESSSGSGDSKSKRHRTGSATSIGGTRARSVSPSRAATATRAAANPTILDKLTLSNYDLSWDQQAVAIAWMLEEVGALTCLPGITSDDLIRFVRTVQANYNQPPFHNFSHAFCVTQVAFIILRESGLVNELSEAVSTMLVLAALCHDVDHEGLTNAYHIATESQLATLYNDVCPMENHHAGLTVALLRSPHSILRNLEPAEAKHFRQVITQLILATDMAKHDQVLSQGLKLVGTRLSVADPAHLTVLLQTILKAADLSNELRETPVADGWSSALYEELNLEMARLHRPPIPTDVHGVSRSQIDFLKTKVLPIWTCLDDLIAPAGRSAASLVRRVKDAIMRHEGRVLAAAAAAAVRATPTTLSNPMKPMPTRFVPAPPGKAPVILGPKVVLSTGGRPVSAGSTPTATGAVATNPPPSTSAAVASPATADSDKSHQEPPKAVAVLILVTSEFADPEGADEPSELHTATHGASRRRASAANSAPARMGSM
ncbi:hypothetical protein BC828DRAFT_395535 [Blastocladiella britannica]|nr:hypothetical protein BC828DRAFT_395535 [Blastocladiella britannica]